MCEENKKQLLYIAGPMRGLPGYNHARFNAWAKALRSEGFEVENPVEIGERYGTPEEIAASPVRLEALMAEELGVISLCDGIFLLRGWENSEGARREVAEAIRLEKKIYLEPNKIK